MKKYLSLSLPLALLMVGSLLIPVSAAELRIASTNPKTGLSAKSWPIARPSAGTCSTSAIRVSIKGDKPIKQKSHVVTMIAPPEGAFKMLSIVEVTGLPRFTVKAPTTLTDPTSVGVEVVLCSSDLKTSGQTHLVLKVELRPTRTKVTTNTVTIKMDILDTESALAGQRVIDKCIATKEASRANLPVAQLSSANLVRDKWTDRVIGATVGLEGTLFLKGVAMKSATLTFFQPFRNKSDALQYPGKLIGTLKTDNLGQFEAKLKLNRDILDSYGAVQVLVDPSIQPIMDQALVFGGAAFELKFDWLMTPGSYMGNKYDIPPVMPSNCDENYGSLLDYLGIQDDDENSRLARYLVLKEAGRWFNGFKEAGRYTIPKCYDSSWGAACNYQETGFAVPKEFSFGSLGSRCWNRNGHTRTYSSGKTTYVNSHNACRR